MTTGGLNRSLWVMETVNRVFTRLSGMVRVGVNGYGTIGKRVADAIVTQPDLELVGVGKTSPDFVAEQARLRGYDIYTPESRQQRVREGGIEVAGTVETLIETADIIVDATPGGVGAENAEAYTAYDTPAIFQGAEDHSLVDVSFNARSNYEAANGADRTRVVSCNTTGLCRLLTPLADSFGVEKARVTLIRRGGDPAQSGRGPIDAVLPDPVSIPSHHGPDVQTVLPDIDIDTMGTKVPTTHMHMHAVNVTLEDSATEAAVRECLAAEPRLLVVPDDRGFDGTGTVIEFARDSGRMRNDLWENVIWGGSIAVHDNDLYVFQAIHQESNVVPENIDAIRAVLGLEDSATSRTRTNEELGVGLPVTAN